MSEQPHPTGTDGAPLGQPNLNPTTSLSGSSGGGTEGKQTGQPETGAQNDIHAFEELLKGAAPDTKLEVTRSLLEKYLQSETDRAVTKALKTREATLREKLISEVRTQVRAELEQEIQKKLADEKAPIEERLHAREMESAKLSAELTAAQEELKSITDAITSALATFTESLPKDVRSELENEDLSIPQRLRLAITLSKHFALGGFGGKPVIRGTAPELDVDAILKKITREQNGSTEKEAPAYPKPWKKAGV